MLARLLAENLQAQGAQDLQIITLMPQGDELLPTVAGLPDDWLLHEAVLLPDGIVVDPTLEAEFSSVADWQQTVVGNAPTSTGTYGWPPIQRTPEGF